MSLLDPILLFPTISALYVVSVCVFLYLWGESPFFQLLRSSSCQLSLAWWIAAALAARQRSVPTAAAPAATTRWVETLQLLLVALVSLYLLRRIRVELVEGGPPPEPYIPPQQQEPKVIVVTGCNAGIGKETLRLLLPPKQPTTREDGATTSGTTVPPTPKLTIVMACRSVDKAKEAWRDIARCHGPLLSHSVTVDVVACDLSDLERVRRAAAEIRRRYACVHVLINNAGLMMERQQFTSSATPTKQPYEVVLTANHLGHFLLTRLLQPTETVINVTSCTYTLADPDFVDDLFCTHTRSYTMFGQYAASKACNLLFTSELARRCPNLRCHAVHPGIVRTDVVRNMPWYLRVPNTVFGAAVQCFQKTPTQGAWNTLHALNVASRTKAPSPDGWQYWVNRRPCRLLPWVTSRDRAMRLWERSSRLVGVPEHEGNTNGAAPMAPSSPTEPTAR